MLTDTPDRDSDEARLAAHRDYFRGLHPDIKAAALRRARVDRDHRPRRGVLMNCPLCTQPMQHAAAAPHLVWYRCPDCRVQVSEAARTFARLLAPLNFKRDRA